MVCYGADSAFKIDLFAINAKGDTLWFKDYNIDSISTSYFLYKAAFDSGKNIIVAGTAFIDSLNGEQAMLLKFDSSGNLQWIKAYPAPSYGADYLGLYGVAPIITNSNQYLLLCQVGLDSINADFLVIKTDTNGNELSRWQYGTPYYDLPLGEGLQTSDSGFLFVGETNFDDSLPGPGNYSIYVIKADKNGLKLWDTIIPEMHGEGGLIQGDGEAYGMIEDTDGYIICGGKPAIDNIPFCNHGIGACLWIKCWAGKLNKNTGGQMWGKFYGPDTLWDAKFTAIARTPDGNFVLTSKYDWNNYTANNAGIYKINGNGDSLWSVFFNYHDSTNPGVILYAINTIGTSGYLASGFVTPNNANPYPWVVTVDSNGYAPPYVPDTVSGIVPITKDITGIALYPNPTGSLLYVNINATNATQDFTLQIYDVSGRLLQNEEHVAPNTTYPINVSSFANGMYFAEILSGNNVVGRGRFVKENP